MTTSGLIMPNPAFHGEVEFEITFKLGGCTTERRIRVRYAYTPDWSFYDPSAASVVTSEAILLIDFDLWAIALPKRDWIDAPNAGDRYWTPMNHLKAAGVLTRRTWERVRERIDADARHQDMRNRVEAGLISAAEFEVSCL